MDIRIRFVSVFITITIGVFNSSAQKLKVITFNIGGDYNKKSINRWGKRMPLMTRFMEKESPDILCLQEAHSNQSTDIVTGFPILGIAEDKDEKEKPRRVHNSILYRKDKFIMIDCGTFSLSENPDSVGSIGWDAKFPRIASWINLRYLATGEVLFVINVHLDNVGRAARVEGIKLILEKIRCLSKSNRIILTGDFNSSVSSKVHKVVSKWGLYDTYLESPKKKGVHYTFHQYGQRDIENRKRIDFVFTDPQFQIFSVNIPKEKSIGGVYISDHNPVIVEMNF